MKRRIWRKKTSLWKAERRRSLTATWGKQGSWSTGWRPPGEPDLWNSIFIFWECFCIWAYMLLIFRCLSFCIFILWHISFISKPKHHLNVAYLHINHHQSQQSQYIFYTPLSFLQNYVNIFPSPVSRRRWPTRPLWRWLLSRALQAALPLASVKLLGK